jgi:copper(I)-binding protein
MLMNRPALALLAPLALAALAGCQKSAEPAAQSSQSAPETGASTEVVDSATPGGKLVLPVIAGHPAAAYIAWRNTGSAPVTITGIEIASAKSAELHETKGGAMLPLPKLTLKPGQDADFAPGGRHVMVFGLPTDVKAGDHLAYRLLLSDGTKVVGALSVETAMPHDMGGMKM